VAVWNRPNLIPHGWDIADDLPEAALGFGLLKLGDPSLDPSLKGPDVFVALGLVNRLLKRMRHKPNDTATPSREAVTTDEVTTR